MVTLSSVASVLQLYFRALCGRSTTMVPYEDESHTVQRPDSDTTMHLPGRCTTWPDRAANRDWYKVATTHRALHYALGTFQFRLARTAIPLPEDESADRRRKAHDLERFFGAFPDPALAMELFVLLEDARVDEAAKRMLPGLRAAYLRVQRHALDGRPSPASLPPRAAVAEALVQFSLGRQQVEIDSALAEPAGQVAAAVARCMQPQATVETSAEQAVTVYSVLTRLPNITTSGGSPVPLALPQPTAGTATAAVLMPAPQARLEGGEVLNLRLEPVQYRDIAGPRYAGQRASSFPVRESIFRLTDADVDDHEHHHHPGHHHDDQASREDGSDPADPADPDAAYRIGPPKPLPHEHGPPIGRPVRLAEGPLTPQRPGEAVYPEWDHVAQEYLADWCLVREERPARTTDGPTLYRQAVRTHAALISQLVASLGRMSPAGHAREYGLVHGDDYDLDAVVAAMVDVRAGLPPSDRVYTDWSRRRRDVAAALAIDLSSSTAERIAAPRPGVRRILDVEREAIAVLMAALDRLGDSYGCYGFSGTGRAQVELTVLKEFSGLARSSAPALLEQLRPMHTTRMGPVIRHLTAKLVRQERPTRLLVIVSDGRPYDLDYGQQYGEEQALDYALADTAQALTEARRHGVRPLLVTVDPAGDDYLRSICDPMEYRVIQDVHQLPAALLTLYTAARSGFARSQPVSTAS